MDVDYPIVDTDVHYRPPLTDVARYMDDPWKSRFERDAGEGYLAGGFWSGGGGGDRFVQGRINRISQPDMGVNYPQEMGPEEIPNAMEFLEADAVLVLDHILLGGLPGTKVEDDRIPAYTRGMTRYLIDQVIDPDEGIYSALPIPLTDPAAAVELIEDYGDEEGFVGIYLITGGTEPPLGHRRYEPMYAVAEEKGLPGIFHTSSSGLTDLQIKGYEKFISTHTLGFMFANMAQLTSLVIRGIPEKFPDLDVVFLESGVFYVATMMSRLDSEYMKRPSEAAVLTKRPSEYMKEFYYGTQPLESDIPERYIETTLEMIGGPERLMYASDFPHWDFDRPTQILDRPFLSEGEKRTILSGNAREVFGI